MILENEQSAISQVVRHVEHPELLPERPGLGGHRYMLPLLLIGLATLVVGWQYAQRPHPASAGSDLSGLSPAAQAQKALDVAHDGDRLYAEGKGRWDDDEAKMEQAMNRYLEAWRILNSATEYPGSGKLIHDSETCRTTLRDLPGKIDRAWQDSSSWNWGKFKTAK